MTGRCDECCTMPGSCDEYCTMPGRCDEYCTMPGRCDEHCTMTGRCDEYCTMPRRCDECSTMTGRCDEYCTMTGRCDEYCTMTGRCPLLQHVILLVNLASVLFFRMRWHVFCKLSHFCIWHNFFLLWSTRMFMFSFESRYAVFTVKYLNKLTYIGISVEKKSVLCYAWQYSSFMKNGVRHLQ